MISKFVVIFMRSHTLPHGIKHKLKSTKKRKSLQSHDIEYELETRVRGTEGQTMNAGKLWGTYSKG